MMEIWKISNISNVEVSDLGNVRIRETVFDLGDGKLHRYKNIVLRQFELASRPGEMHVTINKKQVLVRKLVCSAFFPDIDNVHQVVYYRDGNRKNNCASNYEIISKGELARRSRKPRKQAGPGVRIRCKQTGEVFRSIKSASASLGISTYKISRSVWSDYQAEGFDFHVFKDDIPR